MSTQHSEPKVYKTVSVAFQTITIKYETYSKSFYQNNSRTCTLFADNIA